MRIAVAVSGGRDSTALLHCTLHQAAAAGLHVCALHVHHGLHPAADDWAAHVGRQAKRWAASGLPLSFHLHRVATAPTPGDSIEAWARRQRYEALAAMARGAGCDAVMLAHHRRDQAETVVLQALRGAGAAGLSAMPSNALHDGIAWLRPWLDMPRGHIEAYVARHRLRYIDDGSNDDTRFARNRLRRDVWPALAAAFPEAEAALTAVARRAHEARCCLDELATLDLQHCCADGALDLAAWAGLSDARRANSLRAWLARCGIRPDDALVRRLLGELAARRPARWPAPGGALTAHRGWLRFAAADALAPSPGPTSAPPPLTLDLSQPGRIVLPSWHGALVVEPSAAGGLQPEQLRQAECRARIGGETFQLGPGRPARPLKKQFQALGVPAWQRSGPLVYTREGLAFVPGLGIDVRAAARAGGPGLALRWEPDVSQR